MAEEMATEQLKAEIIRAEQLAQICNAHGYRQAGTIHLHTRDALTKELALRAEENGGTAG